jgi:hypothetical protein
MDSKDKYNEDNKDQKLINTMFQIIDNNNKKNGDQLSDYYIVKMFDRLQTKNKPTIKHNKR